VKIALPNLKHLHLKSGRSTKQQNKPNKFAT